MASISGPDQNPGVVVGGNTLIQVPATSSNPLVVTVGGQQYRATSTLQCALTSNGAGGLDTGSLAASTVYYLYAVAVAGALQLIASLNWYPTGPSGYSVKKSQYIGVFQTNSSAQAYIAGTPSAFKTATLITATGSSTYTKPLGATSLRVRMAGPGGGGGGYNAGGSVGGSGSASASSTTFGSLLTCNSGGGGIQNSINNSTAGTGGAATVSAPAVQVVAQTGGPGQCGSFAQTSASMGDGGNGGTNSLGGGGGGGSGSGAATAPAPNTGAGGGGGGGNGTSSGTTGGAGGGAGGYLEALIPNPAASYSVNVAPGGSGGSPGGQAGSSGVIVVDESYAV